MSNLIRQGDANLAAFGQFGSSMLTENSASEEGRVVVAITFLAATNLGGDATVEGVSVTTEVESSGSAPDLSSQNVPAGVTVFGRWKRVVPGGAVIAYYGE